jgi:hypothetical protein
MKVYKQVIYRINKELLKFCFSLHHFLKNQLFSAAVFFIHKFTIDKKLAYKIQSVEDKTYMAIDEEFENLIMKVNNLLKKQI